MVDGGSLPLREGGLAEWLMAAVLKTVDLNGFGGSNPSPSAEESPQFAEYQATAVFLVNTTYRKTCRKLYCFNFYLQS